MRQTFWRLVSTSSTRVGRLMAAATLGVGLLMGNWRATGGEIDFREDFSLARDRTKPLAQLIPGTEDYYYYHALHYLATEQYEKVGQLMPLWVQRHGETSRVFEIRTRQALQTYEKSPEKTLAYLRNRLGLHYPFEREILGAEPNLPTALDPAMISREQFANRAAPYSNDNLEQYEESAFDWLIKQALNPLQRRSLLARLGRPDHANLPKLIVDDLNHEHSGGFGSLAIHNQLLLTQLEEILKLKPDLLNNQNFVVAYLVRLQPTADEDPRHDQQVLAALLDRQAKFADRLSPAHNSLKAHVLYNQLLLDRQKGIYDKEKFLAYLKLPRHVGYVSRAMQESQPYRQFPVDLNQNYGGATLLPPIGQDEPLVRTFLLHFLRDAADIKEFEPYVNDTYLKHLLAEVKIVNGLGDAEKWASLLPPEQYKQLKERVDIDFAFTNKTSYSADEAVALDLHIKNAGTLIVKVFELNTKNFYRSNLREVDTDINLDGLVPNYEQTHQFTDAPVRRVPKKFEFPQLSRPGIYVIDFIGNGRSSRALVRKGGLKQLVRTSAAGQVFTVLDDKQQVVKNASIYLGGHEYTAEKDGTVIVPFSTNPNRATIVISAPTTNEKGVKSEYSSLGNFLHEAESYGLSAGFYVDRESLLKRKTAKVLIRSSLNINGTPVTLGLLEEVKLLITSTDLDGVAATQEIPNLKLFEDRETVHEFQVPQRLAAINFQLTAQVKQVSNGSQKVNLSAGGVFTLNEIDRTDKIEDLHLMQTASGYIVELRGKTGESKVSRPVNFVIKHRNFRQPLNVTLKSDPSGRINLGQLIDIANVTATGPEGTSHNWQLRIDAHTYPWTLHGKVGDVLTLPYLPRDGKLAAADDDVSKDQLRQELSLLEVREEKFVADRFDHLSIKNGLITFEKLPAGDYDLFLKSHHRHVKIRVTAGEQAGRYALGKWRQLETQPIAALQINAVKFTEVPAKDKEPAGEKLVIELKNATKYSRVHVFATRFVPEYSAFDQLARVHAAEPYVFRFAPAESAYLTGRNIGDEYRYIIDRKYAPKFPGNLLDRPSLLLNPWAVRATQTGEQVAQGGDAFRARGDGAKSQMGRTSEEKPGQSQAGGNFADIDFLSQTSAVLVNLAADEKGIVEIDRVALGSHQQLHIVAVDPSSTTYRSLELPEVKMDFVDLRLINGLDPKLHFTQQKQITIVPAGKTFTLNDITTSKFEAYDSLARVYSLYATLSNDPKLAEFAFILNWPKLKAEEKKTLYSKYASHELSFFLFKKDPQFFKEVIVPYLANKKDKTFVDNFLLEKNLDEYLKPWNYGQLNTVERILLAQRLKDERLNTSRFVNESYSLLPPNIDNFIRLFDTAVRGGSMDTNDALGLVAATGQAMNANGSARFFDARGGGFGGGLPGAPPPVVNAPSPLDPAAPAAAADMPALQRKAGEMDKLMEKQEAAAKKGAAKDGRAKRDMAEREVEELRAELKDVDLFYDADGGEKLRRSQMRQLFRQLEKTMEWAENNYHHLTIDQQNTHLISVNAFWKDFAEHDPATAFYTRNAAEGARNFPEMMFALSVLDLPFESPKHETKFDGAKMTLVPGGPLVVFHEEIRPAPAADGATKVLVSQNFYRQGDRHRQENGEQVDKFVTEEFLVHTVYGCQVVVTNPTSARQKLNLLLQIPVGAIPVLNSQATKTVHIQLEPYHTQTLDYHFYFPTAGKYVHFPVHVAKNETLIASPEPFIFSVVDKPTKVDTQSWDYISQNGTNDQVLEFLRKNNIQSVNLVRIAWRMKDAKFFTAVTELLAKHHIYNEHIWSYSLLHNVPAAAREYLQYNDRIVNECGGRLTSALLVIDPIVRRQLEHLEYKPLVNARAHALGKRRHIVNDRFFEQYHRFLKDLSYQRELTDEDLLAVTYYELLQDRIEEALATYDRVNPANLEMKLQYDYCTAYLDFFTGEHAEARAIAMKHANHPVDRWRNTFGTIIQQLDEAEGKGSKAIDPENRNETQGQLASTEPSFEFLVEAKQVKLDYQNVKTIRVNYYEMDVELLFSRNPFQQVSGQFNSIKPNLSQEIEVPADKKSIALNLPPELANRNVLVEIVAGGVTKTQAYYAHSLTLQVIENYGQVKVTQQASGKPVPKAYVKVYATMGNGEVKFYKDGYTDIRGRFDYASLSTNDLDGAQKFSLLVLSDDYGAMVREATPPQR
ncbi:hypothetical protein [Anatilimnocola floriformis]|uniref:hypothetical protein n=1 Tax=Anatilimnocola floriformis TaxID=2948575 RepID=UPI0020C58829|nr:hypothetical protein [Anatilimnocola floriformis]